MGKFPTIMKIIKGKDNDVLPLIYCTTVYIIILAEPDTPLNDADHVGSLISDRVTDTCEACDLMVAPKGAIFTKN